MRVPYGEVSVTSRGRRERRWALYSSLGFVGSTAGWAILLTGGIFLGGIFGGQLALTSFISMCLYMIVFAALGRHLFNNLPYRLKRVINIALIAIDLAALVLAFAAMMASIPLNILAMVFSIASAPIFAASGLSQAVALSLTGRNSTPAESAALLVAPAPAPPVMEMVVLQPTPQDRTRYRPLLQNAPPASSPGASPPSIELREGGGRIPTKLSSFPEYKV